MAAVGLLPGDTAWVKAAESTKTTCAGPVTSFVSSVPVLGVDRDLPQAAGNEFQLTSDTVKLVFDATQRTAQAR